MSELVQIQPIPPLRQSTETMTACPLFYVEVVIKGRKKPGSLESARGSQVHKVMADYAAWCARQGKAMDLDAFDRFAKGVGPTASKILVGMRDSYQVDYTHLLATELTMSLDENLNPTDVSPVVEGVVADSHMPAHYQGTLDAPYLFPQESKALIDDAKTYPRPFDPGDTDKALQGKMYSLFMFLHFPWLQTVTFRLVFVRFKNLTRDVTYTREDIPALIETVKAARERQKMIHFNHANNIEMEATPGEHCQYCPLLSDRTCPIAEFNPQMQLSQEDRLRFHLWYKAFSAVNNKALREYVNGTGRNVILRDYNGKAYSFGPVESTSKVYPLFRLTGQGIATDPHGNPVMPIVGLLMDYAHASPDDTEWMGKLVISSTKLNSYLGTKKRAFLDQAVSDTADKVTKAPLKVSKPLDAVEEEEPEDDEEWGEDDEF